MKYIVRWEGLAYCEKEIELEDGLEEHEVLEKAAFESDGEFRWDDIVGAEPVEAWVQSDVG
jgi:hypothetical protein